MLWVRGVVRADFSEMQELQIACIRGLIGVYKPRDMERWVEYTPEDMETWVERLEMTGPRYDDCDNLVCLNNSGQITAFVSWRVHYHGRIACLYTHESYRRRGIGSLLLQRAEAALKGRYVQFLATLNAMSFYERHDYGLVKYPHDTLFPMALMEKQL